MKGVRKAQNLRNRNDRNQNYNYICFQVENRLLRNSAEELNLTDETDMVELKETPRNSQSTKSAGQGTQKSTSAKEAFPGCVGLQASFVPPNISVVKEVNPTYLKQDHRNKNMICRIIQKEKINLYLPRIEIN